MALYGHGILVLRTKDLLPATNGGSMSQSLRALTAPE